MDLRNQIKDGLVEVLAEQIDGTTFRTIRCQLLDPASGIVCVMVVMPEHNLAATTAALVSHAESGKICDAQLDEFVEKGMVKFLVPDATNAKYPEALIALDSIPDDRHCRVLLLDKCYAIQFGS
jgi:hypothetical protein